MASGLAPGPHGIGRNPTGIGARIGLARPLTLRPALTLLATRSLALSLALPLSLTLHALALLALALALALPCPCMRWRCWPSPC